jgi:hypothetical protein
MNDHFDKPVEQPESFIVQNVTLGPHYVSDIRIQFDALSVIDLTWEDPKVIRASKDLRNSLRMGLLKKITPEQWDVILEKQANKEKRELLKQQGNNRMKTVEVDGKELQVEALDANKVYKPDGTVSTAGYANDSLSYTMALDIAQTQAELMGEELTVEEFAERVQQDPSLVNRLMSQYKNMESNASVSGDLRKGKAYVATAPDSFDERTAVKELQMSNVTRDGYLAGSNVDFVDAPSDYEDGIADVIDLEAEDDLGSEKGSVRRV